MWIIGRALPFHAAYAVEPPVTKRQLHSSTSKNPDYALSVISSNSSPLRNSKRLFFIVPLSPLFFEARKRRKDLKATFFSIEKISPSFELIFRLFSVSLSGQTRKNRDADYLSTCRVVEFLRVREKKKVLKLRRDNWETVDISVASFGKLVSLTLFRL